MGRFQIKYAGVCKCPTSGGSKVIIPLRNSYRKDYRGVLGHKVLYFENNIDCIYCFIPDLDKGIFITGNMVKPGQTMFHLRVSAPMRLSKRTRMWYHHTDFNPEVFDGSSNSNGSLSVS